MYEYDQISDWYAANRHPAIGVADVMKFAGSLGDSGKILDLGCGNGVPISQTLARMGFDVFGIDSSPEMISQFRTNVPHAHAQCATLQESDFFNAYFDAVVAWGVVFHLTAIDQARVISKVSHHLKYGGKFFFTAGDEKGVTESTMNGVTFRYVSLGSAAYRSLLQENGFEMVAEYRDARDNYVYIAQKLPDTP